MASFVFPKEDGWAETKVGQAVWNKVLLGKCSTDGNVYVDITPWDLKVIESKRGIPQQRAQIFRFLNMFSLLQLIEYELRTKPNRLT